ncbi:MAG: glycosyltransferase, partial [Bacteroidales bacterium]|nr:glycosyltransferase [Bacteroidales bacterium]
GGINLLSIGRFCSAKNYDNVPDIARRMVDMGVRTLKWYIIGFGGDEVLIRSKIREAGMEEHVILLGKKENPYPYIKACDIYVQPSRYEGKSVTVREAQMLCKPVVVTAYPTAASQIRNGVDGVIVPLDNAGAAKGLAEFIANTALQTQIKNYLQTHDYANLGEVEKIYSLLK